MQSNRGVICELRSRREHAVRFVISTILIMGIAPNLRAQPANIDNENNAASEQPISDSQQGVLVSSSGEKEPDLSAQRAADDSLDNSQTNASDQPAPVDFGVMDAPQLKTTVPATTAKKTQTTDSTTQMETEDREEKPKSGAPKARIGAQLSIWNSFSIPFGKYDEDHDISHIRGVGVNNVTLIGYKILPELLIGLQIDMMFYGVHGRVLDEVCEDEDSLCISRVAGISVQTQVHLLPNRFVNPWIGYGLGISSTSTMNGFFSGDTLLQAPSFDFAKVSTGADFRFNRVIGFGPFIGFSAGVYFYQIESDDWEKNNSEIEDQALHFQLDIGVRVVFTP